jgi:hypothetical protein
MLTRRLVCSLPVTAQLDKILSRIGKPAAGGDRVGAGLKEALSIGAENAVTLTGVTDGYFKNQLIKILLPEKLRPMEKAMRLAGAGPQIDDLVMGMNRAAEKAAPLAKQHFKNAILAMTIQDAKGILTGGETAATEYFKSKTADQLTTAFRPPVAAAMQEVGVVRQFDALLGSLKRLPFLKTDFTDIEGYVVRKALDGLFLMVGEEEKKIRKDPAAQVTALLREVFGRK